MTDGAAERSRRVEAVFQDAADLPPAERAAALDRACGGDAALRAEVESLLRQLDAGTIDALKGVSLDAFLAQEEKPGDRIGRYKLEAELGRGGFGVVWRAEQTEPVRRTVALKIIKLGMDTRRVAARFEQERQTLAVMDHPCVSRVLDAGATERGRPYFVMELVAGEPITRYCDERKLPPEARLRLMRLVCDAVHHAHQKGVIHRDLKPSNILVQDIDGRPTPKVIDFGIARAIDRDASGGATLMTEEGQLIGTPEYMSPEQASGDIGAIDTRTDIYSLGVVLYELLTGDTPLGAETLRRARVTDLARLIGDTPPARPSTRAARADAAAAAARRAADGRALARRLRGDADWIVMKALEKEPSRRYGSAAELGADIDRLLENRPVSAGPPSRVRAAKKFVQRNRLAVSAAALLALALVGAAAGTSVGMARARAAEREARATAQREAAQRALAEKRFSEVRSLANTLIGQVHDAIANLPGSTEARRLVVDTGLKYVDALVVDAGDDPGLQLELCRAYQKLGDALGRPSAANLGDKEGALAAYMKGLAIARELHNAAPDDTRRAWFLADSLVSLGNFQYDRYEVEESIRLYEEAGRVTERWLAVAPDDPEAHESRARVHASIGRAQLSLGLWEESLANLKVYEDFCRERLAASEGERFARNLAVILDRRGQILYDRGRHEEAVALREEAIAILRKLRKPDEPLASQTSLGSQLVNLSYVLSDLGRGEESLAAAEEALEIWRAAREADPADARALRNCGIALHAVGLALADMGRRPEAIEIQREYVALLEGAVAASPGSVQLRRDLMIGRGQLALELARAGACEEAMELSAQATAQAEAMAAEAPEDVVLQADVAWHLCIEAEAALAAAQAAAPGPEREALAALAEEREQRGEALARQLAAAGKLRALLVDRLAESEAFAERVRKVRAGE